ncbi:murein L,D-transpeptidase family protein [Sebaldella sp. S0638]|uniref:L,D-transpeptidase family protein n=1 Tax=Sebaldella sp. S0638 TaxID=2957809 RepID=UPI00209DF0F6|nr:murein L,D-transpeptidase family protein [Sebaldella sp. S0638]MCP1223277.1 murein L,D-transpeptidase [Sebaldella sp. S0638]
MGKKGKIVVFGIFLLVFLGVSKKISFEKVMDGGEDIISTISLMDKEKESSGNEEKAGQEDVKIGNPLYIRVFKEEKELEMWIKNDKGTYSLYKVFDICTFSGGLGPKKKEGDKKSPEGFYYTKKSFLNPNSSYHLSFNIGYPNEYDKSHGYTGSLIMIHGNCVSIGCYAMTDKYIEEIYGIVEKTLNKGQEKINVDVFPFKMKQANMKRHKNSEYYSFWEEIKFGYDYFEKNKIPPKVIVENKKYKLAP